MLIAGGGGHAKEVIDVLVKQNSTFSTIYIFDEDSKCDFSLEDINFELISSIEKLKLIIEKQPEFVLATGSPQSRKKLYQLISSHGGIVKSCISTKAEIGNNSVKLGQGLNILPFAYIAPSSTIGKGSLIHSHASIHHDSHIGNFCEISPGARILGNVTIGDETSIGTGAIILPGISIGKNSIIGAGAVVRKNIPDNSIAVGVPAKVVGISSLNFS